MAKGQAVTYRRVYVWELPVRIYHWVNFACVVALVATGFAIGRPVAVATAAEAYQQYWFGWVRVVHFIAAYVFFFNFLVRIYWGFVGNRHARWRSMIPLTRAQWREVGAVLRVDVLLSKRAEIVSLGHNALAGLVYFLSFLACAFQAATGFALYSSMSKAFVPRLFNWVVPLMGGDFAVRQWHHVGMWFFIVFAIIHVYLVFYHDYIEGRGTTSSMAGGWKFEREDALR
jgi:Ni/Fe-hydrogenase 1 B-type cytochrome subunit